MKHILLLIIITLISCKTDTKPVESRNNTTEIDCALLGLKKTADYKNEIKKHADFRGDTIIQIEQNKIGPVNYKTVFGINEFEEILWLIVEKENKTDSIVIHYRDYVESISTVDSEFDLNNCEIAKSETEFSLFDGTEKTKIKTYKLK